VRLIKLPANAAENMLYRSFYRW